VCVWFGLQICRYSCAFKHLMQFLHIKSKKTQHSQHFASIVPLKAGLHRMEIRCFVELCLRKMSVLKEWEKILSKVKGEISLSFLFFKRVFPTQTRLQIFWLLMLKEITWFSTLLCFKIKFCCLFVLSYQYVNMHKFNANDFSNVSIYFQ
jgi:hypothetical protein